MLTPEEEKFVRYWANQRQNKKRFLRNFSIVLPIFTLIVVVFFVNFLSGWYRRADKELSHHSSLIIVIFTAVAAVGVFLTIFTARHKWEQNEAEYERLVLKQLNQKTDSGTSAEKP